MFRAAFGNGYVKDDMGCMGISEGDKGVLEGVRGTHQGPGRCLVVFFPSISFNVKKLQMRSLTCSSRSGGSSYLKYQNVPKLR